MPQRTRSLPLPALLALAASLCLAASSARAQDAPQLDWARGPGTFQMGDGLAEIDLGSEFVFLDAQNTRRFMEALENPLTDQEVGTVAPASDDEQWFVVFEWDPIGYVEDKEDDLDANALLSSIKEASRQANAERRQRGWTPMTIVGWQQPPHYDRITNNLTWAIVGQADGAKNINHIIKLLGRRGVMTATLVASPEDLRFAAAATDEFLLGYRFNPGNTYAEYRPGSDKLAEYGLAALVVGGAGAALVSTGILARFWKLLVVGFLGVVGVVKKIFGGGKQDEAYDA